MGNPKKRFKPAFRRYMAVASVLAFSGPLPRFLTEYGGQNAMGQIRQEKHH